MTQQQIEAIYKLYPQTVRTVGDIAYDAEGNEVAYDLQAVTALAKLAKRGLTEDEVKALVG